MSGPIDFGASTSCCDSSVGALRAGHRGAIDKRCFWYRYTVPENLRGGLSWTVRGPVGYFAWTYRGPLVDLADTER